MWASLNLLALLSVTILALTFGDRTIRAVSIIMLLGVVSTILLQRVTRSYTPTELLFLVDALMLLSFIIICTKTDRRWCHAILIIQGGIVGVSVAHLLNSLHPPGVYLHIVAVLTYLHAGTVTYALLDRYFGPPYAADRIRE